jgi:[ribosomal protein S5]-alanine N-acetyltransferase
MINLHPDFLNKCKQNMSVEKYPTQFPVLESERILLRRLSIDDLDDVFEYGSDPGVTPFVIFETHKTKDDSLFFIKFASDEFEKRKSIIWAIELKAENKMIGTIDLRNYNSVHQCGEIGYVIGREYWSKGLVTEAMKAVIHYGFDELQLNRIEAHCEHENTGSWRVMEKCGMKYEGTLREKIFLKNRLRSMKMYSILKSEWIAK